MVYFTHFKVHLYWNKSDNKFNLVKMKFKPWHSNDREEISFRKRELKCMVVTLHACNFFLQIGQLKGSLAQRKFLEVEKDPVKLCNYLVGGNIFKVRVLVC